MKIILAPDSFKGTFSSSEVIERLRAGCSKHFPDAEVIGIPMADGGEGTLDAFVSALGFEKRATEVRGPLGQPVQASYGIKGEVAVIEMAQASGLGLIDTVNRNPLHTTSYGTGELILRAVEAGARRLLIGIGGSATNDGGMGMSSALGVQFYDEAGRLLAGCGDDLERIAIIDDTGLDPRLKTCEILAICDVSNPLTGSTGATRTYGPQKGATPVLVDRLEAGMESYKGCLKRFYSVDPDELPGSGAAGGLGAAIAILLKGRLLSGIDAILEAVGFDDLVKDADFVITGEGCLDAQSVFGKVPYGIGRRCKGIEAKVFVLAGMVAEGIEAIYENGIDGVYPVTMAPCTLDDALGDAPQKLDSAIDHMLRLIKAAYTM